MGIAGIALLAVGALVVVVYLCKGTPSARRADERRRWWAFTDRGDPNPYFAPRDPTPGDSDHIDGSGSIGGGTGPHGY